MKKFEATFMGKKFVPRLLVCLPLLYLGVFAAGFFVAEKIAFPVPKVFYELETQKSYIQLHTRENTPIAARYLKNESARYTVLYSHGNGEDLGQLTTLMADIFSKGYSVLAYDYEGYGRSGGKPTAAGLRRAAQAAWDFLTEKQNVPPQTIVVMGYSLGSHPSCYLAANGEPRALVLLGAFYSGFDAVMPLTLYPVSPLDNRFFIRKARCPVLIMHGTADNVVPFRNGKRLHAAAPAPNYFVSLKGANHFEYLPSATSPNWPLVQAFIEDPKNFSLKTQP